VVVAGLLLLVMYLAMAAQEQHRQFLGHQQPILVVAVDLAVDHLELEGQGAEVVERNILLLVRLLKERLTQEAVEEEEQSEAVVNKVKLAALA
jgi:hypothetical protein